MIPAPPRQHSLLRFAEAEIGGTLWKEYVLVRDAGRDALKKSFVPDQPLQDLARIPYDRPEEAQRYLRRLALERQLVQEISARAAAGEWRLEGREEGAVEFTAIDPRVLRQASISFERNSLSLDGRHFEDMSLTAVIPDQLNQIARVIRVLEPRFDPRFHQVQDLKEAVEEVIGRELALTYFREAMVTAEASPQWSDRRRKRGSPSFPRKK